jgi:N-acetylmuramoyl-L-alanine amidase
VIAPVICLDPGHGTPAAVGRQVEPIGPGSRTMKIKDGGGAAGEAAVALAIARRARELLVERGYRVAMTRTTPTIHLGDGNGNIARARYCNRWHAALMVRIHADGSGDTSLHGVSTLVPAWHRGWTDDIYTPSLRAGRAIQRAVVRATGAADRGLVQRGDLTGFNWADVPAVLVETGFLSNPAERRLLQSGAYQQRVARGLLAGVGAFVALPRRQSGELPRISSAAARPRSWTALRRSSTSPGPVTSSTGVSAASNSSRSSTIVRDSSSLRRNSSARGSSAGTGERRSLR